MLRRLEAEEQKRSLLLRDFSRQKRLAGCQASEEERYRCSLYSVEAEREPASQRVQQAQAVLMAREHACVWLLYAVEQDTGSLVGQSRPPRDSYLQLAAA